MQPLHIKQFLFGLKLQDVQLDHVEFALKDAASDFFATLSGIPTLKQLKSQSSRRGCQKEYRAEISTFDSEARRALILSKFCWRLMIHQGYRYEKFSLQ